MRKIWWASFVLIGCTQAAKRSDIAPNLKADWKNPAHWSDEDSEAILHRRMNRIPAAEAKAYRTSGTCGGLPRVQVKTAPGFCVGLVSQGSHFKMPRVPLALKDGSILVSDMGSWSPTTGRIHRLKKEGNVWKHSVLLTPEKLSTKLRPALDRVHHLALGPDGKVYAGAATGIYRFDANNPAATMEAVVTGIPAQGLHPLKMFVFGERGDLFVNVGSATNVCQKFGRDGAKTASCPEVEDLRQGQGQVRRYRHLGNGKYDTKFEIYAKGLRNSMGLLWDEGKGALWQIDNGRDSINKADASLADKLYPHEEFNVLRAGRHYGWPYCFDDNRNNPEWHYVDCRNYEPPQMLIPAHAAPLGMIQYRGDMFPAWYKNRLLVSFHGYADTGHRLVAYARDEQGLPTGSALSVIYGWGETENGPRGAPVGMTTLSDGSVMIVEDLNDAVLRLFYDSKEGDGTPVREIDRAEPPKPAEPVTGVEGRRRALEARLAQKDPPIFSLIQRDIIDLRCVHCHGGGVGGLRLVKYDDIGNEKRLRDGGKAEEFLLRVEGHPDYPPMPPEGFESAEAQEHAVALLKKWLAQ